MRPDHLDIPDKAREASRFHGAPAVAAGVLVSRACGFLREMTLAYFFGAGPHADVFRTALRGPNLLQNLLGEQTLSASFIPVYSRLLADGRREDAGRFAGAIFGLLLLVAGSLVIVGMLLAEPIVGLLAPGYLADGAKVAAGKLVIDRYPLAVKAVRIIFPMTGVLVLSAWALGVLNSHRRFFLPYLAPALWNSAIVAALVLASQPSLPWLDWEVEGGISNRLLFAACAGALIGGLLQFVVQIPAVLRVMRGFRLAFSSRVVGVAQALRAFAPLAAGRGAVQLSSYLDLLLASFLAAGALAALGYAQVLYLLPISLFGMSVAAAELPELARGTVNQDPATLRTRLTEGVGEIAFWTAPAAVGYLAFGLLLVGALFRRGSFGLADNWLVYLVLASYSLGLIASSSSRALNNLFYALGLTNIPARIAVERVVLSAVTGSALMLLLDRFAVGALVDLGGEGERGLFLGAVGLALGAAFSSWYELMRLDAALRRVDQDWRFPWPRVRRFLAMACGAAIPAAAVWAMLPVESPILMTVAVVVIYTSTYVGAAARLRLPELRRWLRPRHDGSDRGLPPGGRPEE